MEKLGYLVKDSITGLIGVATAYESSPFQVARYHVQPLSPEDHTKMLDAYAVDDTNLSIVPHKPRHIDPVPIEETSKFNFLDEVQDQLTGFKGKIATRIVCLNGCVIYGVSEQYRNKDESSLNPARFSNNRLKLVKAAKPSESNKPVRTGGFSEKLIRE